MDALGVVQSSPTVSLNKHLDRLSEQIGPPQFHCFKANPAILVLQGLKQRIDEFRGVRLQLLPKLGYPTRAASGVTGHAGREGAAKPTRLPLATGSLRGAVLSHGCGK